MSLRTQLKILGAVLLFSVFSFAALRSSVSQRADTLFAQQELAQERTQERREDQPTEKEDRPQARNEPRFKDTARQGTEALVAKIGDGKWAELERDEAERFPARNFNVIHDGEERPRVLQRRNFTLAPARRSGPLPCPNHFGTIGIFIVYTNSSQYQHAMNIMRCYAISRGYKFFLINPYEDRRAVKACSHVSDVMFKKHCAAAEYLGDVDWLMVTDGDTAVINPDRCVEHYLDPTAEIMLYERFFSAEIMSGSYIAKSTEAAARFMREWAELESEQPPMPYFFSADNGAVHLQVLKVLYPARRLLHKYCMSLLRLSRWPDWEIGYGQFLRCAKRHMLEFSMDNLRLSKEPLPYVRIRMLPRGQSWCRDAGFTFYHYYSGDFMSHNVKDAEPFDEEWLAGLGSFWDRRPRVPRECHDPKWRPKLDHNKSGFVSRDTMRQELSEAGKYFGQNEKLHPLFASDDIGPCWPNCPDVFRSYSTHN